VYVSTLAICNLSRVALLPDGAAQRLHVDQRRYRRHVTSACPVTSPSGRDPGHRYVLCLGAGNRSTT